LTILGETLRQYITFNRGGERGVCTLLLCILATVMCPASAPLWTSTCFLHLSGIPLVFFCIFFWRARVCRPLLRLCRPFMIFEGCLDSNPECCRSKLARYRLSHHSLSYKGSVLYCSWRHLIGELSR
jgi:hypothetical protein